MSTGNDALQRAAALVEAGQPARAIPLLLSHLASSPDDASGHALLALALLGMRDYSAARESAERATSLDPDNEVSLRVLALSCARLGDRHRAVQAAETAQEIAPNSWAVHHVRANVDMIAGKFSAGGSAALSRMLELGPGLAASHTTAVGYLLGTTTLLAGDRAIARSHLTTALNIDPNDSYALYLLGNLESRSLGRTTKGLIPTLDMLAVEPMASVNRRAILSVATSSVRLLAWIYTVLLFVEFLAVAEPQQFDYLITASFCALAGLASTALYVVVLIRELGSRALVFARVVFRISNFFPLRLVVMALSFVTLLSGPLLPSTISGWCAFVLCPLLVITGVAAFLDHLRVKTWRELWHEWTN